MHLFFSPLILGLKNKRTPQRVLLAGRIWHRPWPFNSRECSHKAIFTHTHRAHYSWDKAASSKPREGTQSWTAWNVYISSGHTLVPPPPPLSLPHLICLKQYLFSLKRKQDLKNTHTPTQNDPFKQKKKKGRQDNTNTVFPPPSALPSLMWNQAETKANRLP